MGIDSQLVLDENRSLSYTRIHTFIHTNIHTFIHTHYIIYSDCVMNCRDTSHGDKCTFVVWVPIMWYQLINRCKHITLLHGFQRYVPYEKHTYDTNFSLKITNMHKHTNIIQTEPNTSTHTHSPFVCINVCSTGWWSIFIQL